VVQNLHDAYREAIRAFAAAYDEYWGDRQAAGALRDVDFGVDREFIDSLYAATEACDGLEEIAADNSITVDLRCGLG
jgi:hypothetical protein